MVCLDSQFARSQDITTANQAFFREVPTVRQLSQRGRRALEVVLVSSLTLAVAAIGAVPAVAAEPTDLSAVAKTD